MEANNHTHHSTMSNRRTNKSLTTILILLLGVGATVGTMSHISRTLTHNIPTQGNPYAPVRRPKSTRSRGLTPYAPYRKRLACLCSYFWPPTQP